MRLPDWHCLGAVHAIGGELLVSGSSRNGQDDALSLAARWTVL
jgi:hypothetical protein